MARHSGEKIVLVTGGNRGIGREVARQLGQRGWRVFLAARDAEAGGRAAEELRSAGATVEALTLDVSDFVGIRTAVEEFGRRADRLDVLVNNAGVYLDEGVNILTVSRNLLTYTFQTNTFGPVEVTQAFLPFLRASGAGRIINVSSGYGQLDGLSSDVPSYCLSKLALNGVTLMLAPALKADGIAVNSMCPGWVRTDMGGPNAARSVEEGADTAVWLAAEAPQEFTGRFFRDRKEIPW
jgi:NAD(P)-dependent dehydrogenase (short-subunit alcohol dehydrogenase family)